MKKVALVIAAISMMVLCMMPVYAAGSDDTVNSFKDVDKSHWAASEIMKGVQQGYVAGYTDQTFKPNAEVTRAEYVKMVVAALKLEVTEKEGTWYVPYVEAARAHKLVLTTDFVKGDWNTPMSRQEMSRVAARAVGESTTEDDKWMYLATKKGLITGVDKKGTLGAQLKTTRAQAVTIIERVLAVKSGKKLPVDKYAVSSAELAWHKTNIFTVMPEVFVTNPKDYAGKTIEELWREDKMILDSKDGKYRGELEALIAIDLEDPNDPNLKLLPDINKLKWFNNNYEMTNLMVKDHMDSYVLYFKGREVYNKDTKLYSKRGYVPFNIRGIESPDIKDFFKGKLNRVTSIYIKADGDFPAMIVPKKGLEYGSEIVITISTPAFSNSTYKSEEVLRLNGIN